MNFYKTEDLKNRNTHIETAKKEKEINMTLDYYNKNAIKFSKETLLIDFKEKRNILLKYLKPEAHILDLGCGSGRDSKAFISKGYKVTAVDGSEEICKIASRNIGQEVICRSFQYLNEEDIFDAVWACASIMHVPYSDLQGIIGNISKALKSGGYLYSSFKYGDFEGEINGRYFTYFKEDKFKTLLDNFTELELIEVKITKDVRIGRENEKWLNVIVKKN